MKTTHYKGFDIVNTVGTWFLVFQNGAYLASHLSREAAKADINGRAQA